MHNVSPYEDEPHHHFTRMNFFI